MSGMTYDEMEKAIVRVVEKVVKERDELQKIAGELAGHLKNFIDDHNQSCTCDYCTTLARWEASRGLRDGNGGG